MTKYYRIEEAHKVWKRLIGYICSIHDNYIQVYNVLVDIDYEKHKVTHPDFRIWSSYLENPLDWECWKFVELNKYEALMELI